MPSAERNDLVRSDRTTPAGTRTDGVLKLMSPACPRQRQVGSATAAGLYDDIRQCPVEDADCAQDPARVAGVSERASRRARASEERSEQADSRGPHEDAQRFRGLHVRLREEAGS